MDADDIIHDFMFAKVKTLEQQIEKKGELLDLFMDINDNNDNLVGDQIAMITTDLKTLIDELVQIRRDSELISPKTQGVIDRMGNIRTIKHEKLVENLKGKYLWQDTE